MTSLPKSTVAVAAEHDTPAEWRSLRDSVALLPPDVRAELEPVLVEAMEHARFRERALRLACEAVANFRLERAMMEFDRDATRREHDALRRQVEGASGT